MSKCVLCGRELDSYFDDPHACSKISYEEIPYSVAIGRRKVSSGDPLLSGLIAYGTDSAILGTLLGGSIGGAILGDLLDGDLFD